jgi:hypothetical protein
MPSSLGSRREDVPDRLEGTLHVEVGRASVADRHSHDPLAARCRSAELAAIGVHSIGRTHPATRMSR